MEHARLSPQGLSLLLSLQRRSPSSQGDLEELLGAVPPSDSSPPVDQSTLPAFPSTPEHPAHLVIVSVNPTHYFLRLSLMCGHTGLVKNVPPRLVRKLLIVSPYVSLTIRLLGIPMAFGAGFKLNNKDNSRSRHSLLPQDTEEPRRSLEADLLSPSVDKPHDHHHSPTSWSSMLETWYCHQALATAPDPNSKLPNDPQRTSPYELLIKERMMGLYLAVFIHRDARPFVKGAAIHS